MTFAWRPGSQYDVAATRSADSEEVLGSEIAARSRKSLATFHRTLKSQCSIALSCLGNRAISGGIAIANRKNRCDFRALSICVTVRLLVRPRGETMYWQTNANTPLSVTPLLMCPIECPAWTRARAKGERDNFL